MKHHYVPAFLLQNFTPTGRRDDFLCVYDKQGDKWWDGRPDEVGFEHNYNRVDLPEGNPNAVESYFSQIDSRIAPIIQQIVRSQELPKGVEFKALIQFVALLALRSPSVRNLYERNLEYLEKERLKLFLSRRDLFDEVVEEQRRAGKAIPPEVTYEKLRAIANDDEAYDIKIPRTHSVGMLLKIWPDVAHAFQARQWSLLLTRPDEDFLICSDMPVTITSTSSTSKRRYLGFSSGETILTVPLSRSTLLVGSYNDSASATDIDLEQVRHINRRTRSFAERFVYSSGRELVV